jgi:hypothetical protein
VLILGIGIGIAFSSTTTLSSSNVASREFIDTKAPNPEICVQYGASAMVMDARLFVTLNPFNVYVAQPNIRPGCVIRQNNWAILENKKLVTSDQVRECKNRLNTFGFTGDLNSEKPDISTWGCGNSSRYGKILNVGVRRKIFLSLFPFSEKFKFPLPTYLPTYI